MEGLESIGTVYFLYLMGIHRKLADINPRRLTIFSPILMSNNINRVFTKASPKQQVRNKKQNLGYETWTEFVVRDSTQPLRRAFICFLFSL